MKKVFLIAGISISFVLSGCKKYLDVNTDPNNPVDVQEALLLAPIELNISDNISAGFAATIIQNYVQAIAANQPNPTVGNYQLFNVDMDGDWFTYYVVCLNNLKILNTKAVASGNYNYTAISKILTAYTLGSATDIWGDIPYSQGFQGSNNFLPAYDKQEDVYKTIQSLLTSAIADIAQNTVLKPGGDDYFYNGDMVKWRKLAYTLKARYFIHLTKAPGYTAAAQADSALLALQNGMQSNDDDLKFQFSGSAGSENNWNLNFSPVTTYVLNSTFVESLKTRVDPRLAKMVKPAESTGLYTGRTIGTAVGDLSQYSYPADAYAATDAPNYIVNYSEALFIKAEATLIKSGFAAAQPFYVDGINSHFAKLGFDITAANVVAYVNSRALTSANALQRIMEEKSVANFLNLENFNDWRRTGYPAITKVAGALSEIPRRLLYPQSEILTNKQPQQTAQLTDKIWWDQ